MNIVLLILAFIINRAIEIDMDKKSKVDYLYYQKFSDFDYLPDFFAKFIRSINLDRLSAFAYLKRAIINKSLGNISDAMVDVELYCKLHRGNHPTVINGLTNGLLDGNLKVTKNLEVMPN